MLRWLLWRGSTYAFPFGEGAPARTLGRMRLVRTEGLYQPIINGKAVVLLSFFSPWFFKCILVWVHSSLIRPGLRRATFPRGEGFGTINDHFYEKLGVRLNSYECRMQNEGIPSGDKNERSDKGMFSPGNQEIYSQLPACFIHPEGIPSFSI